MKDYSSLIHKIELFRSEQNIIIYLDIMQIASFPLPQLYVQAIKHLTVLLDR